MNTKAKSKEHIISAEELKHSENKPHLSSDYIILEKNEETDRLSAEILNCAEDDKYSKTVRLSHYYKNLKK